MATRNAPTLDRRYLELLSRQFPTSQSAFTEIINLEAILNLPKGTEHFVSDVHGEYEAFCHILNNCSGVIRERIGRIFRYELTGDEQAELCTLIYYPEAKLRRMNREGTATDEWYRITLMRLMRLARMRCCTGNDKNSKSRRNLSWVSAALDFSHTVLTQSKKMSSPQCWRMSFKQCSPNDTASAR